MENSHGIALPLLMPLIILLVIGLIVLGWLAEKKRREAFVALAARLGLNFTRRDDSIPQRFGFLDKLRQGSNRYACNVLWGDYKGHHVTCFDYHYETESTDSKGNRQTHDHWFSFFVLEQELQFPELRVYPENILSKLGQALGYQDIDFESAEFSRKFTVRSPDRRFAYDIIHPRMMEYLLAHPQTSLEIENQCVALGFDNRLDPAQFETMLARLVEMRELFPAYLYAAQPPLGVT